MSVTIPAHLRPSLNEYARRTEGFTAADHNGLPTLNSVNALEWSEWVNSHKSLLRDPKNAPLSTGQAADDLRALAGQGGKSYTALTMAAFNTQATQLTYETKFLDQGFDQIHSQPIQQYVFQIALDRGTDSAKWAINYATAVETRQDDPLLDIPRRSPPKERVNAVAYANGFLATGNNGTKGGQTVQSDAEQRLYSRLHVARLVQESHEVDNHGVDLEAIANFKRVFDRPWAVGSKTNTGLQHDPRDSNFNAIYENFEKHHDAFAQAKVTQERFIKNVSGFSDNLSGSTSKSASSAKTVTIPITNYTLNAQYRDRILDRSIAIEIEGHGIVTYDVDPKKNFTQLQGKLPEGVALLPANTMPINWGNDVLNPYPADNTLTWLNAKGKREFFPMDTQINTAIAEASAVKTWDVTLSPREFIMEKGHLAADSDKVMLTLDQTCGKNEISFSVQDVDHHDPLPAPKPLSNPMQTEKANCKLFRQ